MLHLVGYLYFWQMGFNSVFKGLTIRLQGTVSKVVLTNFCVTAIFNIVFITITVCKSDGNVFAFDFILN